MSTPYDLRRFWDLICEAGLDKKKIGELSRPEVEKLMEAAYQCTSPDQDQVPF